MRRGLVAGALTSLVIGACFFPATSGLGPGDAATEAGATDGVVEAAPDTGPEAEAGPFCQTLTPKVLFCEDFDEGSFAAGWDGTNTNLGTLSLSGSTFVSSPASLLATTPSTSSGYLFAQLEKQFTGPIGNAALAFDIYLGMVDPTDQYTKVVSLTWGGNNPPFVLFLQIYDPSHIDLAQAVPQGDAGVGYVDNGATAIPPLARWTHVEIDLTQAATGTATASASVSFDGQVVIPTTALDPTAFGNVTLDLGLAVGTPTQGYALQFDDVTFDTNR